MTESIRSHRYLVIGAAPETVTQALQAHGMSPAGSPSTEQWTDDELSPGLRAGIVTDQSELSGQAIANWPALPLVLLGDARQFSVPQLDAAGLVLRLPQSEAAAIAPTLENFLTSLRAGRHGMVAADEQTENLARLARQVAASDATVMLQGESGTGKEVFARYLHEHSGRALKPFVAINCAAIPESMLEVMLFGHEKGAFTGAVADRSGKFEQANGGTLLLDEISEMSLGLQAKLLRVIQEQELERLGGNKLVKIDVRVIATTNRNIQQDVENGTFRRDLFYRLSVFPIALPPLRERPEDIVPLALRLAWRHGAAHRPKRLEADALRALYMHSWPGNVRELDNVIQRAIVLSSGVVVDAEAIRIEHLCDAEEDKDERLEQLDNWLRRREHQLIVSTLRSHEGNRTAAARQLGISTRTLRYKLAQMRDAGVAIPA